MSKNLANRIVLAEAKAAVAEAELTRITAVLAAVRELHSPVVTNEDYPGLKPWCDACGDYSPCETAQALDRSGT